MTRPHSDAHRRRLALIVSAGLIAAAAWVLDPPAAHAQGASSAKSSASAASGASVPPASQPAPARSTAQVHPKWEELTPVQQRILAPLEPGWESLGELHRRKWLQIAERYPKYSPAEQAKLQARMSEWARMTPQQRRVARENYQITRSLPASKKAEAWNKYQSLPEEQKKKLADAESVPHRPGAVSALPSSKRLPVQTGKHGARPAAPASAAAAKAASGPAADAAAQPAPASSVPVSPAAENGTEAMTSTPADTISRN